LIVAEHLALLPIQSAADRFPSKKTEAATPNELRDLKSIERELIAKALEQARFSKTEAARALGLTRAQLYTRLKRYQLD